MLTITFLGTGTSTGVPEIGCSCHVCRSDDPRDKRLRTSALVEMDGKRILIDCGPDFREQMLRHQIDSLDALLITHEHYDHVGGLDDIRPLIYAKPFNIFLESNVEYAIRTRMPYAFGENRYPGVPNLNLTPISLEPFEAVGIPITPIRLQHARLPIVGYRIGNLAYLTDFIDMPESEYKKLEGVKVLVVEALRHEKHPSHASLPEALEYIARINPETAYLVHMSHRIGLHEDIEKELPSHVHFAYDGLQVTVD